MPQRKFLVATEILVFDFELFIGGLWEKSRVTSEDERSRQIAELPASSSLDVTHSLSHSPPMKSSKSNTKISVATKNFL
jgi:hypothetical protein